MQSSAKLIVAAVAGALFASTAHAQLPGADKLRGIDVQKILEMKARAEAAQAGQGRVNPGDVSQALGIASQLGLSPEQLASQIHARAGANPALKGMSKAQLAGHIRALARKHGKPLSDAKRPRNASPQRRALKPPQSMGAALNSLDANRLKAQLKAGQRKTNLKANQSFGGMSTADLLRSLSSQGKRAPSKARSAATSKLRRSAGSSQRVQPNGASATKKKASR